MSDYPQNAGTGFLRRNEKASEPSHPSHTGTATINGQRFRISAWVNESDDGKKYFKLNFRPDERQEQGILAGKPLVKFVNLGTGGVLITRDAAVYRRLAEWQERPFDRGLST